jgi:DNA modification methylase
VSSICLYPWKCKCGNVAVGPSCSECKSTAVGEPVPGSPRAELFGSDCIAGMAELLAPASVDLIVTSIPFEELFTYSGKPEDVGNNGSTIDIRAGRFALNMRFVVDAAFRVMKPGTNFCCHIQQLLSYKVQHGFMGRRDFRGAMVEVFSAGGFKFTGEFVIPKNPQQMAQRLNLHSLQFKTGYARDGNKLAPAINDYVLIFQKPGDHPTPPKPLYDKKKNPTGWVTTDEWVRDASGIWTDIIEIDVLDGARGHKEEKQEKHVCPLQLEVIRRLVRLYTNPISIQPDVTVLDPFMGIGSTAYVAVGGKAPLTKIGVEEPRNAVGFELKESYHKASVAYVSRALVSREKEAEAVVVQPSLYDDLADEEVPAA